MLVRKQIVVSSELDARIRRLARARRVSKSRIVALAVEAFEIVDLQLTGVLAFAGTIKRAPRTLSEETDETLYG
jgi:predicted transcriptional regulator